MRQRRLAILAQDGVCAQVHAPNKPGGQSVFRHVRDTGSRDLAGSTVSDVSASNLDGAARGAAERDVYPTRYRANTPTALADAGEAGGLEPVDVELVGTLHRYAARVPVVPAVLRALERMVPETRRSTIVASYRARTFESC